MGETWVADGTYVPTDIVSDGYFKDEEENNKQNKNETNPQPNTQISNKNK